MTGPDAIATMEARLIAVERRCVRLEDDTRTLARGLGLAQQRTWESWTDFRARPPAVVAPASCVTDFPNLCNCFASTFTMNDSYYGDVVMTYDPASLAWKGCNVVSRPADGSCSGAVTFALHYTLSGSNTTNAWSLTMTYVASNFTTHCPIASTCGDATNQAYTATVNLHVCNTSSVTFTVNGTIPGTQAWPVFRNVTLTIPQIGSSSCCHPSGICSGIIFPSSIPFTDSQYGPGTLTYDSAASTSISSVWTCCLSGLTSAADPTVTFALHYQMSFSPSSTAPALVCSWDGDASFKPVASNCGTTTVFNGIPYTFQSQSCPGTTYSATYVANASLAIRTLYQSNVKTVTIGPFTPG